MSLIGGYSERMRKQRQQESSDLATSYSQKNEIMYTEKQRPRACV